MSNELEFVYGCSLSTSAGNVGTQLVAVYLRDVNDNGPEPYTVPKYCVFPENTPVNQQGTCEIRCTDKDSPEYGPPFNMQLDQSKWKYGEFLSVTFDAHGDGGNGSMTIRPLVVFDREAANPGKILEIPLILTDRADRTNHASVHVIIGDENDNPMHDGKMTITVNSYLGKLKKTQIGRVYVEDLDDWDLGDKTFTWRDSLPGFELSPRGEITMDANMPPGTYHMSSNVHDNRRNENAVGYVTVNVLLVPEVAFVNQGSMQLLLAEDSNLQSPEDFIRPDANGKSMMNTFTQEMINCECRNDLLKGPRCQGTTRSFSGDGYAWYKPMPACTSLNISMQFMTLQPDAVLFYNGPMDTKNSEQQIDYRDYIIIQLRGGRLAMEFIELVVDQCRFLGAGSDDTSCRKSVYTPDDDERLNIVAPVQIGGLAPLTAGQAYPSAIPHSGLNGCIRNLRVNDDQYDLATPSFEKNSAAGCKLWGGACDSNAIDSLTHCVHGDCYADVQGSTPMIPKCICDPGWGGPRCEKKIEWIQMQSGGFIDYSPKIAFPEQTNDIELLFIPGRVTGAAELTYGADKSQGCVGTYRWSNQNLPLRRPSNQAIDPDDESIVSITKSEGVSDGCSLLITCAQLPIGYCSGTMVCMDFWKGAFCTCPDGANAMLGDDGQLVGCGETLAVAKLGISNPAIILILVSLVLLIMLVMLMLVYARRQTTPFESVRPEDLNRDNLRPYAIEGGGEADNDQYSIANLRKPVMPIDGNGLSLGPPAPVYTRPPIDDRLRSQLHDLESDQNAAPFDEIRIYEDEKDTVSVVTLESLGSLPDTERQQNKEDRFTLLCNRIIVVFVCIGCVGQG
ncbi:laminin G domain protein [Necator americanus]|uniref:Laminin G domain protein n=1 Tax=Necator americanus TaxID=51031 RepID=W2TJN7_NECAM|nr:laminin G domain protein [Necator americanus]ETN81824.1 laminin G domain protein [Necator americanus]